MKDGSYDIGIWICVMPRFVLEISKKAVTILVFEYVSCLDLFREISKMAVTILVFGYVSSLDSFLKYQRWQLRYWYFDMCQA